jgi:hypothetical protein
LRVGAVTNVVVLGFGYFRADRFGTRDCHEALRVAKSAPSRRLATDGASTCSLWNQSVPSVTRLAARADKTRDFSEFRIGTRGSYAAPRWG